ncbi:MAG: S-methyl-5-thioribose-1-phosphate isomerase [Candidatus Heimdallarchaeota archaeon]|nr:S-methyl-5-thioribose-1-phosphate isomerase [Candidatus Heimdallarchaeota archaeon]
MKVKFDSEIKEFQSIWWDTNRVKAIDQRKLPFLFEIFDAKTIDDICFAIKDMVVRGAPLIGVTAAYGLALHAFSFQKTSITDFLDYIDEGIIKLSRTRPTAVDLFNTLSMIRKTIDQNISIEENLTKLRKRAETYANEIIAECRKIGEIGNHLISSKIRNIMTICNAGALATVDIGTALAPIRQANSEGKKIVVYVNETRPRLQGARLTAWELYNENIEHYIHTDNAAGYLINKGLIDLVIVGADRIALNGDTANKIGTYTLSVLCKENKVPFYIAAPLSTFDTTTKQGNEITIEERDGVEVKEAMSIENEADRNPKRRIIHHVFSTNINPAFDITPAKNITGIITPKGILNYPYQKSIKKLLNLQ